MPKIEPQTVPITLKGLAQKSPPNLAMPGEMVRAENVMIAKGNAGGVQFVKRYGNRRLQATAYSATGATAVNPKHLVTLGADKNRVGALVLDNDETVFARDTGQDAWFAYPRNGFNWSSQTDAISQSLYQKTFPSHAYDGNSGNEMIAWYDQAAGVRFSVRNRATGAWLEHDRAVTSLAFVAHAKVQCFAHPSNGYFYIFAPQVSGTSMAVTRVSTFTPSEPVVSYSLPLDGCAAPGTSPFDVQMEPGGLFIIVARVPSSTDTQVVAWDAVTAGFVLIGSSSAFGALTNAMWLSQSPFAAGASRRYYLGTTDSVNGLRIREYNQNAVLIGDNLVDPARFGGNIAGYFDGVNPIVFVDAIQGTFNSSIWRGATIWQRSVTIASRAFLGLDGRWYCLARYDSYVQPAMFLVDLVNLNVVAKVALTGAQWSSLSNTYGQPPWVTQVGASFSIAIQESHTGLGGTAGNPIGTQIQGVGLTRFDWSPATSKPAELGGVLHYPGSIPWIFDGAQAVESGFNVFPETVGVTDAGSGGSKTPAATYGYRATYGWRDIKGNYYESAPSLILAYVAANNHNLNVEVPTCRLTRRADITINLYRNDPQRPTEYRLVNAAPVVNVLTADSVIILDDLVDLSNAADWATRALLYNGDGGASGGAVALEHTPPPAHTIVATAQGRNFLAGIDQDSSAVRFSNEYAPDDIFGQTGISYPDSNVFRIRGSVTAVVGRDRNVVIFTDERIWTITGEFPDATGGSFPIPRAFELPHELGAVDPNAIVVTSLGIFFQSKKGLHILGWDWSIKYIGADVEDVANPINAGLEVPSLHQVRLYQSDGTQLVWDTMFNTWTTYNGLPPGSSACNWQGVPCFVDGSGQLWQETPGQYGDAGAFIRSLLRFAFIAPAGIRGYFCLLALQFLGKILGPHRLNAALAYNSQDFDTTNYLSEQAGSDVYGDVVFGVGTYGGEGDSVLKLEIRPKKRQCAAYQVTVWDSLLSSDASQGFSIEGMSASIGIEQGLARTKASQRMTKL